VLFKLGQGRAVSKGLLNLACVFVLGSHGHHLRAMKRVRERGPPDLRARSRAMLVAASCAWYRRLARPEGPFLHRLAQRVPTGRIEAVISLLLVDFRRLVRTSATRRVTS
jgi:hypothetical protein